VITHIIYVLLFVKKGTVNIILKEKQRTKEQHTRTKKKEKEKDPKKNTILCSYEHLPVPTMLPLKCRLKALD
jgi:hypothetical protein